MDGAMSNQVSVSPDAVEGYLENGDALINFSFDTLSCSAPFVLFAGDGSATLHTGSARTVGASANVKSLTTLLSEDVQRFVIVSDGARAATEFATCLGEAGIPHKLLLLAADCNADAFMDEEDSEAVAERLRQLGYI
jgi:hypothetical protein